jgi:hypothetical protein
VETALCVALQQFPTKKMITYYKSTMAGTSEPTPHTLEDCRIMLERASTEAEAATKEISELKESCDVLQQKLKDARDALVQAESRFLRASNRQKRLLRRQAHLEKIDRASKERQCYETYLSGKDIPHDAQSYLSIKDTDLSKLTLSEVRRLAIYVWACELVTHDFSLRQSTLSKLGYSTSITYGELWNSLDEMYGHKIIGEVTGCDGLPEGEADSCCHKRYACTLKPLEHLTLDDYNVILQRDRVN